VVQQIECHENTLLSQLATFLKRGSAVLVRSFSRPLSIEVADSRRMPEEGWARSLADGPICDLSYQQDSGAAQSPWLSILLWSSSG
jgi:hypothetical protein